jgi:copper resistance protein B
MRTFLLMLIAAGITPPAWAQHADHGGDEPAVPSAEQSEQQHPHTEHGTEPELAQPEPIPADPHGVHDVHAPTEPTEAPAQGHHADHDPAPPLSDPHGGHEMPPGAAPPPADAFAGPRHAADILYDPAVMQAAREHLRAGHGAFRTGWFLADRVERGFRGGSDIYLWDVQASYGGDVNKLWLKSEGEGTARENVEEVELQVLWSRAISPWFDFQAGVRYDFRPQPERAHLVLGLQGLVPYRFELDSALFLSEEGDVTARIEAEYDLRITQRLILQPRVELDAALSDDPEVGVASGVNSTELGVHLRYEVRREFAPYIGISWEQLYGGTADLAGDAGEPSSVTSLVLGFRAWF